MASFNDSQRRDVLMLRALNYTYDEIAAYLNENHGMDVSGSSVGRLVRSMEEEARNSSPREVFDGAVMHGFLEDLLP